MNIPVQVARLTPDGDYGYLTRDDSWALPVTLFDKDGQVIWRAGGIWPGIDDSSAGAVSPNGNPAIVVGYNGGGGVALVDDHGQTMDKTRC